MTRNLITSLLMMGVLLTVLSACKEEPKPKVQEPVKVVFDPKAAQQKISKRLSPVEIEAKALSTKSEYIQLLAHYETNSSDPAAFLSEAVSDDTVSVVVLAHIENGPDLKFPALPLYIFSKDKNKWQISFQAKGPLTPLFVAKRAPFSVVLEIVLLKNKLDGLAKDAQNILESYNAENVLYSKDRAYDISAPADAFAQRIGLAEEANFKGVAQFDISYLENFGTALNLLGQNGTNIFSTVLSVEGKTSVLPLHHNTPPKYSSLLTHKIGHLSPRAALGDLEKSFWRVPLEALEPSCQAVQGALIERLGLSRRDSAIILWRMMQPHALFGDNIDYRTNCTGEDIAVLLKEAGLTLPPIEAERASGAFQTSMNKTLTRVATLMKNPKESNLESLSKLMDENVLVRDEARLLFSTSPDRLIDTSEDVVAPTLSPDEAADYLMMLPLRSFGCYSKGQGQVGQHRATLMTMENDPHLWLLNMAFSSDKKISGLYLQRASQRDFCRAIGGRKGENRCTFSNKNFPGLEHERCG
ncbi:MAG: hypothetical protein HWE30_01245 [Methylocystaceae bacterium]|nr:hypothetical protein [Methylocystaceae bacterium]